MQSYHLALTRHLVMVQCSGSSSSPMTAVTMPPNSTIAFPGATVPLQGVLVRALEGWGAGVIRLGSEEVMQQRGCGEACPLHTPDVVWVHQVLESHSSTGLERVFVCNGLALACSHSAQGAAEVG